MRKSHEKVSVTNICCIWMQCEVDVTGSEGRLDEPDVSQTFQASEDLQRVNRSCQRNVYHPTSARAKNTNKLMPQRWGLAHKRGHMTFLTWKQLKVCGGKLTRR